MKLKHFENDEFSKLSWNKTDIKLELKLKLDKAREYSGIPYQINSAHRTEEQNKSLEKWSPTSSHLTSYAVDIAWDYQNKIQVAKILKGLILAGFRRIGLANSFVHCDIDPNKPDAIWTYK